MLLHNFFQHEHSLGTSFLNNTCTFWTIKRVQMLLKQDIHTERAWVGCVSIMLFEVIII